MQRGKMILAAEQIPVILFQSETPFLNDFIGIRDCLVVHGCTCIYFGIEVHLGQKGIDYRFGHTPVSAHRTFLRQRTVF